MEETIKQLKCEVCGKEFTANIALAGHLRSHSTKNTAVIAKSSESTGTEESVESKGTESNVSHTNIDVLLSKIEQLEKRDAENQAKLKMLYEVADKGRIFNYESSRIEGKLSKVKLSSYQEGVIIGWRVIKDELIKHPTTGLTVGEVQEYELLVLKEDGETIKYIVNGYPAFSNARYNERIEADIIGKKEDWEGKITFELKLPGGRLISLDSRFVN